MTFEFDNQLKPQNYIDINEIGQFAIEAWNDEGYYYYLVIRTLLGTSVISSCGPVIPDVEIIPSGFKSTIDKMQYKEDKLGKTINFWLNDKSKKITNAKEITIEEAIDQFREVKEYLLNFNEETL